MITATLRHFETGDTETENFASYDLLDDLTREYPILIISWEHWEGGVRLGSGSGRNAEPELRQYLRMRGELAE